MFDGGDGALDADPDGVAAHEAESVRAALQVAPDVPIIMIDARRKDHVKTALTSLVKHGIARARAHGGGR